MSALLGLVLLAGLGTADMAAAEEPAPAPERRVVGNWIVEREAEDDGGRLVRLLGGGPDHGVALLASWWRGNDGPHFRLSGQRWGESCEPREWREHGGRPMDEDEMRLRLAEMLSACGAPAVEARRMLDGFESAWAVAGRWGAQASAATRGEIAEIADHGRERFEVILWAGEGAETQPGFVRISDHPCGVVAMVTTDVVPSFDGDEDAPLASDQVAELDEAGVAKLRWSVPVDSTPVAISGRELLVDAGGMQIWIDPAGNMRRADARAAYPPAQETACPAGGPMAGSDYAQCPAFTDLESGARRMVQYEAPCT